MSPSAKTERLRTLIQDPSLTFVMEAHHALSAKIAEEASFSAIWASGLAISAALGVRDNNELSWTQVLEVLEFMADATSVPILMDGDTGHGNFNTLRRLITRLERRGIAGICIEDKLFPKTNSFLRGESQPLAEVEEFCCKIRARADCRRDDDFVLVARTEALVAGRGVSEALRRAEAYRAAGADAIVVQSRKRCADDVLAFLREWANRLPVVLIPTAYHATPTAVFRQHQVSAVIWANHLLRASIVGMRQVAERIHREEAVTGVEDAIAPLAEVFRLQGDDELREAERRYLSRASHA